MGWLAQVARGIFAPFSTGGGVGPSYALSVTPSRLRLNTTSTVVFTGLSTRWLTQPPILEFSSTHGLTVGTPVVTSDTVMTVSVTTGPMADTITWTDSAYDISAIQEVRNVHASIGIFAG